MASEVLFTIKSSFSFVDDKVLSEFMWRTVFSLSQLFLNLFWFIARFMKRGIGDEKPQEKCSDISISPPDQVHEEEDDDLLSVSSNSMEFSSETGETEEKQSFSDVDSLTFAQTCNDDDAELEEGFSSSFKFSFFGQDFEDLKRMSASVSPKRDSCPDVLKYQVMPGSHVSGFMEEPETMSFSVQEMFVDSHDDSVSQSDDPQELQNEVPTYEEIDDDDISYEVELFELEQPLDDDYIEFMPQERDDNEVLAESLSENRDNLSEMDTKFKEDRFANGSYDSDDSSEDEDEDDEFDILLEHKELVKQLKMERKNSILKGLPTISEEEECETPRIFEDLKPLKIADDKVEYKDIMLEIHKFYRSYAEKMRKLDILNYQTLQAISFLQLKDSQLYMPSKKTLISSISFTLFKQQRIFADPSLKSINEMHRDLELVYVGQACLTWEILLWQHGKVKELQEHGDDRNLRSYNQVGVEFQQFQVLLQRFLEDERFQGPRVQHFVRNRCLFRGLLQVPCIKDDCPKTRKEQEGEEGSRSISITMLAEAIEDSMQTFWEFIHADKDESSTQNLNQPPTDSELLQNLKTCLEKKERKIKDIQRSRNCIVKKFQKQKNSVPSSSALLISQVELKLVARVLTMPRLTTDQLTWCLNKLNNISIVNRRVGIEPSFLLFPC